MISPATLGLVLGLAAFLPAPARAQAATPPTGATLEGVIAEIRLLRQAIERQSSSAARAQLLIGRLGLQDQRTARARDAVERLEGELANGEQERDRLLVAARETQRALDQTTDPDRRAELETQSRTTREHYTSAQQRLSQTEDRLRRAREALDVETGRCDDLDRLLADLDRQLQAGR